MHGVLAPSFLIRSLVAQLLTVSHHFLAQAIQKPACPLQHRKTKKKPYIPGNGCSYLRAWGQVWTCVVPLIGEPPGGPALRSSTSPPPTCSR